MPLLKGEGPPLYVETFQAPEPFRQAVAESEEPVLALFVATWCGFCRAYQPRFREAETPGVRRVEVDLSDDLNPLWEEYDIQVVPTLILFRDGEVADRADGRLGRGLQGAALDRLLDQAES